MSSRFIKLLTFSRFLNFKNSTKQTLLNYTFSVTIDTIEELVYSKIGILIWGDQNKGFFLMSDDMFSQEIGAKAEHYTDPLFAVSPLYKINLQNSSNFLVNNFIMIYRPKKLQKESMPCTKMSTF